MIKKKNVGFAVIMSMIFPGLGQIYNGQIRKGILYLTVSCIVGWFYTGIPISPPGSGFHGITITHLITFVMLCYWLNVLSDAYDTAKKINAGEMTG